MHTKYEVTFTDDNQVLFVTDLRLDDDYLTDIPPTLLIPTQDELEEMKSIMMLALIQLSKRGTVPKETLDLSNKVHRLVW